MKRILLFLLLLVACAPNEDFVKPIEGHYDAKVVYSNLDYFETGDFTLFCEIYQDYLILKRTPNGLLYVESSDFHFTIFSEKFKMFDEIVSINYIEQNQYYKLFGKDVIDYLKVSAKIKNTDDFSIVITLAIKNNVHTFHYKNKLWRKF